MAQARYVIGIDLGTSNCALSYFDTTAPAPSSTVLEIAQLEETHAETRQPHLPSLLYLPPQGESEAPFLVGEIARNRTSTLPGRVIHSAKSWLCHPGVDREEKLLPWGSEEIGTGEKLSPVEVEARYLEFLRRAWDERMEAPFAEQDVTITVPASFDESAQLLTLKAAKLAGFAERIHLLEEPQAAFYYWLERHSREGSLTRALVERLPSLKEQSQTVLVCDIGGGTTDFSLFEISPPAPRQRLPEIRRIAVSDHILLGGDNIDLAAAKKLEERLGKLSTRQWTYLVFAARGLKEKVLGTLGGADEVFHVSVPGEGASLFKKALTAEMTRAEAEALVLDGFFPYCERNERPAHKAIVTGLREWGLPYAADSHVTRHLAGFLDGREVDAVLFTGGSLKPTFLRDRLRDQIGRWQGRDPVVLENEEMDLAVARGASYYGAVLNRPAHARAAKIRGGYPHSLYLELYRENPDEAATLVCVLPKGFEAGDKLKIRNQTFKLLLDRPVRFQLYYSNRRVSEAGDLIKLEGDDLHPLPPIQTQLTLQDGMERPPDDQIEIAVEATVSETGLLQVSCIHRKWRWALDFNLRKSPVETAADVGEGPGVDPKRLAAALDRIDLFYGKRKIADLKDTPKNLKRELEKILGIPRDEWNLTLLRSLWPALAPGVTRRSRTPAHEISWLYLAGFCLRPGYGSELDPFRMAELWKSFSSGPAFGKNPLALTQWWILWRRVAGGLTAPQQKELFDRLINFLRPKAETMTEIILLAGSLERLDVDSKRELGQALLKHLRDKKATATEAYLWSLGRLANRVPLYAGAQAALPTAIVEEWIREVCAIDFKGRPHANLNLFLSQAARLTGDRNRDVPEELRREVLSKMELFGASEDQKRALLEVATEDLGAQAKIFGETLPAGLKLHTSVDRSNAA